MILAEVPDPQRFGVPVIDNGQILRIEVRLLREQRHNQLGIAAQQLERMRAERDDNGEPVLKGRLASGNGAEMRRALGVAVFSGMLGVTLVIVLPVIASVCRCGSAVICG